MLTRALFAVAIAVVIAVSSIAPAQQLVDVPRVGFLESGSAPGAGLPSPTLEGFRQGLAELGYVEGRHIRIEARWPTDGRADRLPEAAASLVALKVKVICVIGGAGARAVKGATTTIPVVFAIVVDPVNLGLVGGLEHPGANLTGFTTFDPQQARQQLEILKEAIPGLARVAILGDQAVNPILDTANEEQARSLGLRPHLLKVKAPDPDFEAAFGAATREGAQAMVVLSHPVMAPNRKRIAELAIKHRLPILVPQHYADAGGLLAYGTGLGEAARRAARYVDAILKGAKPGDLPVETVRRHELIINLRTAADIGVTIPPQLLGKASRVIGRDLER